MTNECYVITRYRGWIPQLKRCGPIPQPICIPRTLAAQMIDAGIEIYEYDRATMNTILMTKETVFGGKPSIDYTAAPEAIVPDQRAAVRVPAVNTEIKAKLEAAKQQKAAEAAAKKEEAEKAKEEDQPEVTEEPETLKEEEATEEPAPEEHVLASNVELVIGDDGRVDESKIDWNSMSKSQRKQLRARINEMNDSLTSSTSETTETAE